MAKYGKTQLDMGFNPRTREGCDNNEVDFSMSDMLFQSTHPRGVRHPGIVPPSVTTCFNPRTREGCD